MSLEHKKITIQVFAENSRGLAPDVSIFLCLSSSMQTLAFLFVQKVDAFTIGNLAKAIQ